MIADSDQYGGLRSREERQSFHRHIRGGLDTTCADLTKRQILFNLLSNAGKFNKAVIQLARHAPYITGGSAMSFSSKTPASA